MNLIKRHKGLAFIGGLTLILIIILFIIFAKMIFSNGESIYGQRLNGLVKIDKTVTKEIIQEVEKIDGVNDADIRIQGKIVYMTIIFDKGFKVDKAKEIASNTLTKYNDEVIAYYDFGYFLKENILEDKENGGEKKNAGFLVAGTKHPDNNKISWTK